MKLSPKGRKFPSLAMWIALCIAAPVEAQLQRVSVASDGTQADRGSAQASISGDGQFVAFRSDAANLVAGDSGGSSDVFVRDLQTGTTERLGLEATFLTGQPIAAMTPSISDDGRFVAMQAYRTTAAAGHDYSRVVLFDRQTGTAIDILPISGSDPTDREARQEPNISGDGRFIAFHSIVNMQTTLPESARPPDDDSNSAHDIYVYDTQTQTTQRISRDQNGVEGNGDSFSAVLSDNGDLVAFYSYASNLVPGDSNDAEDVFVKNRVTGTIERVSMASDETQSDGDSYEPALSGDGRFIVFRSRAANLVPNDINGAWDIFLRDRQAGTTERISISSGGAEANADSFHPTISDDGRFVVFRSNASNLVEGDTNHRWDIFVRDRNLGTTARINLPANGQADNHSYGPVISGDGSTVAFESDAANLAAGDTNASKDVFAVEIFIGP